MDSLSGFTVFLQVAEARSFVDAGRRLGISASAVSKAIARLEDRFGARLLHRSTRSVSLTAEGMLFLDRCRRILGEVDAAAQELASTMEAPSGRLKVSLPLVSGLMLPVLSEFAARYPQVELDLHFTDRLVDVIGEGFDAVVRTGDLADSRLIGRRLGTSRFLYVGAPGYFEAAGRPLSAADLGRHRCLLHRFPTSGLVETWPTHPGPSARMVSDHIETLLHMAIDGHGIARLPDFAVAAALQDGRLQVVLGDLAEPASTFRVLWPPARQLAPRIRVFVDFLVERLFPAAAGPYPARGTRPSIG